MHRRRVLAGLGGTLGAIGSTGAVASTRALTTPEEDGPPPVVGESAPIDLDGDGVYEDVNGDGEFDLLDVRILFENYQQAAVQNNPDAFDFSGSGGAVDLLDVRALFIEVQQRSNVIESFEDGDLSEYSGDVDVFDVQESTVYVGTAALECDNANGHAISRLDQTVQRGDSLSVAVRAVEGRDALGTTALYGLQDATGFEGLQGYGFGWNSAEAMVVRFDEPTDEPSGVTGVEPIYRSGEILSTGEWYEFDLEFEADGTHRLTTRDADGNQVDEGSGTDTTYRSGGIGMARHGLSVQASGYLDAFSITR
jgi:hypothetical protein